MIVAVTSWRGVGTTTTALLLALAAVARGRTTWLVEADPAGGVLAGRIALPAATVGGLERRAFPGAERIDLPDVATSWHGVRLVTAPADPFRAHACHHPAAPWLDEIGSLAAGSTTRPTTTRPTTTGATTTGNTHEPLVEPVVVLDVGRMRAGSPAAPLLDVADVVLLVTSPEVSAAVGASEWLAAAGRISAVDAGATGTDLRVVVVESPGGRSFSRTLLTAEMGDRLVGWLPWDPSVVDAVHRSGRPGLRRRRTGLIAEVDTLLDALDAARAAGRCEALSARPDASATGGAS